ncbi:class E sortase [Agrococcus sp. ProA11]|uniref:class E sortase n=1 Tax=Agrococcus chionoecetis TaxID=3153752 RepID=UPI0032613D68
MARQQRDRRRRPRRRATFASVLGELLLTLGVLALGYAGWHLWLADAVLGGQQQDAARVFASELGPTRVAPPDAQLRTDEPPVAAVPDDTESFAVMYIPRLGAFERTVGQGTSRLVLDSLEQGLAHYADSAMPGERGNFAVAGHRNGQGGPFTHLDEMRIGDRITVQTSTGWFVYEFRNHEYVPPTGVGVVAPVPQQRQTPADGAYLTLTTCNPEWSAEGRLIAYATLVGWQSLEDGMPAELAEALGRA